MKFLGCLLIIAVLSSLNLNSAAWPNGPLKALYIDQNINWNAPAVTYQSMADSGVNLIILAFMVSGKTYDALAGWEQVTNKTAVLNYIHNKGARIIGSAGGATDTPYKPGTGKAYGTQIATWAKTNQLDGVDFDLENFGSGFTGGGMSTADTVQWVVDATNAARGVLGASGIITHAPQTPYFGTQQGFNNGYGKIYQAAPTIDFLLIQFYNNGPSTTYASIFTSNSGASIQEIHTQNNIPLEKLVVGKPLLSSDAGAGFVSASDLKNFFAQAKSSLSWQAGVMAWQWWVWKIFRTFVTCV